MDFNLSDEMLEIREMAREFCKKEIIPYADKWDNENLYPLQVIKKMGDLGYFGCPVPEKYGGVNIGYLAQTIITEEIARGSSSIRVAFNTQCLGTAMTILSHGTEEQKQKWIPDLITVRKTGCFAITEPNSGSDVLSMKSVAKPEDDGYILNGSKTWISGATNSDLAIVYAYHDPEKGSKGLSAFIVDMNLEGISTSKLEKLGTRSMPTGEIFFQDVKLGADALLGNTRRWSKNMFWIIKPDKTQLRSRRPRACSGMS